ncbi:MAG: radical SAM protein [Proteobacteria bacterium]|nr:radical SAM protein [Pseudomonadota bacterium]MBU1710182.1 radical SAM protein [Pseudomonadota bacterium]
MIDHQNLPEIPLIRPPSEWRSMLVRITRGCKWNRCCFCGIYPHLGEPVFSIRTVQEIKNDIDLLLHLRPRADTVFLGDADPLQAGIETIVTILDYLKKSSPLKRITTYARASTLKKFGRENILTLAENGLSRVHIGLESGDPETLRYHRKGQSAKMITDIAPWLKEAGIETSFYVLLGLGGKTNWQRHIIETAKIINQTQPEFIRLRRLWIYGENTPFGGPESPLIKKIRAGHFIPQTPEGTVLELKLLLEQLNSPATFLACDHENNYVHVSGSLADDQKEMLDEVNAFLARPEAERNAHYEKVGSKI